MKSYIFCILICLVCVHSYGYDLKLFSEPNNFHEIKEIINLGGKHLVIAENCTLEFKGGSICNGSIEFKGTKIINPSFSNVRYSGSVRCNNFNIEDYGAVKKKDMDCSVIINDLIKLGVGDVTSKLKAKRIFIPPGVFYIKNPIVLLTGYEDPITLCGAGFSSRLIMKKDNEYICKIYEVQNINNISLQYERKQPISAKRSVAIAVSRALTCEFRNVLIENAHTGYGYILLKDLDSKFEGNDVQVYVNCTFDIIRLFNTTSYAFDFRTDEGHYTGDSGSYYNNIYINCNKSNGDCSNASSVGAIYTDSSIMAIGQINIEGASYTGTLIKEVGFSKITINSLHIEGVSLKKQLIHAKSCSSFVAGVIDLQNVRFNDKFSKLIYTQDQAKIDIEVLSLHDCKSNINGGECFVGEGLTRSDAIIRIDNIIQHPKIITSLSPSGSINKVNETITK